MTVEEMFIQLGFKVDQSSKKKVESDANALKGLLTKAFGVIGIGLTLTGVKNFLSECNSIAAEVKATNTQFEQTFKTLDESGQAIADFSSQAKERLKEVSQSTGISATRMKAAFASLGAFAKTGGMETEQALDFAGRAAEAAADNAAYFDKSVEETMDIMKRLMKGNFTLDDNLGFQSTEATRDAQALEMYGQKYKDLLSWQQQEVILQQIINANMAQGAQGQAKREAGEYTNQVGELSENVKMLKANIGMIGLPIVLSVSQKISAVVQKVAEYVGDVNDETSVAARIQKELLYYMNKAEAVIERVVQYGHRFVDFVGGTENAMKLLLAVIAAIAVQQYLPKLIGMFTSFGNILRSVNLRAVALIAVLVGIFLVIDDLVAFMQGRDSLFGAILEERGIDSNAVREKFVGFFENIREKIGEFVEWAQTVPGKVQQFFSDLSNNPQVQQFVEKVREVFGQAQEKIGEFVEWAKTVPGKIQQFFNEIVNNPSVQQFAARVPEIFNESQEKISGFVEWFSGVPGRIQQFFSDIINNPIVQHIAGNFAEIFSAITSHIDPILEKFGPLIEQAKALFSALKGDGDTEQIGGVFKYIFDRIKEAGEQITIFAGLFYAMFDGITAAADPFMDAFTAFIGLIVDLLTGDVKGAVQEYGDLWTGTFEAIGQFFGETLKTLGSGMQGSPLGQALTWLGEITEKIFNWLAGIPEKIEQLKNMKIELPKLPSMEEWLGDWADPEKHPVIGGIHQKLSGDKSKDNENSQLASTDSATGITPEAVRQTQNNGQKVVNAVETSGRQAEQKAESTLGEIPKQTEKWGFDSVNNYTIGMWSAFGPLGDVVGFMANMIKDNIGHSKPKTGPLRDDDQWGLHMMQNLANGIRNGMGALSTAVDGAAMLMAAGGQGMMSLAGAGKANAGGYLGGGSNVTVIQNNNFSNQFNGGDRDNQVNAGRQMRRNADDTTAYLANALAYAK